MRAKALVLCLSTVGCGLFDPEPRLSHAAAMLACGPVDQAFTGIVLARGPIESLQPPFPYVQVVLPEPVSAFLAGRSWDITPSMPSFAWYVQGDGPGDYATSGRVSVISVDSTNRIEGTVDLQFPSRTVEQDFSAPWLETGRTCP